jgi:hypothetical protein
MKRRDSLDTRVQIANASAKHSNRNDSRQRAFALLDHLEARLRPNLAVFPKASRTEATHSRHCRRLPRKLFKAHSRKRGRVSYYRQQRQPY